MVIDEGLRVPPVGQPLADGGPDAGVAVGLAFGEEGPGAAEEPHDVDEHAPHVRADEVAAIGEQGVEVGGPVGEVSGAVGDREAHLGVDRFDAEFVEEPAQVGVVAVVVDDEAGVDADRPGSGVVDCDGVGVAAEAIVGFEEDDVVARPENMGAGESGDP